MVVVQPVQLVLGQHTGHDGRSGDGHEHDRLKAQEGAEIGAVFYIGGNDSMDTIARLAAYGAKVKSSIRFIGVPKTIDNDLMLMALMGLSSSRIAFPRPFQPSSLYK